MDIDRRTFISGAATFAASLGLARFATSAQDGNVCPGIDEKAFSLGFLLEGSWYDERDSVITSAELYPLAGKMGCMDQYVVFTTNYATQGHRFPKSSDGLWWWQKDGYEKVGIFAFKTNIVQHQTQAGLNVKSAVDARLIYVDGKPARGCENLYPWADLKKAGAEVAGRLVTEGRWYPPED